MPAQPNASQTNGTTRTRTNREGPNASQKLLSDLAAALNDGIRVYGADAGKLSGYVTQITALVQAASMGESAKMAATFDVIGNMLKITRPPADATPVPAPAPTPAPTS